MRTAHRTRSFDDVGMRASTKRGLAVAVIAVSTIATISAHSWPRVVSWIVAVAAIFWFGIIEDA
jgi:hypothetical protein